MWETREVTLTLRLPPDIATQAEEVQKTDPEFLSRVVLYGLTRRSIYHSTRERTAEHAREHGLRVDGLGRIDPIEESEGRRIRAGNRNQGGGGGCGVAGAVATPSRASVTRASRQAGGRRAGRRPTSRSSYARSSRGVGTVPSTRIRVAPWAWAIGR